MKRILNYLLVFALIVMASCKDDDKDPEIKVEFTKSANIMLADVPLDITLSLNSAASSAIEIPFIISGSAELDSEYSISANSFSFSQGVATSKVTITP